MWAIRRASNQLRNKGLLSSSGRVLSGKTDFANCCSEPRDAANTASQETMLSCTRFHSKSSGFPREFRTILSKVGAKSKGEDSDNGFSELEEIPLDSVEESTSGGKSDDGLTSGSELYEDEGDGEDAVDESETDGKNKSSATKVYPKMCKAILSSPAVATGTVLDKWVEEGNKVTESDATETIDILRKRGLFVKLKALQLSEWLESKKIIELNEVNVAARVALLSKVRGLFQAENYVKQLPESLRTELVNRTLLASCVVADNRKKSEELFNKMKASEFPLTVFACNQMLLLYKRADRRKIADILKLMEEKDLEPSVYTYKILIDVKGQSNSIAEMEDLLEKMKAQGLKPTSQIQRSMAQYYANAGLVDKAEAVLKEMEGDGLEKNRWAHFLLPFYTSLGRAEEVERVSKICESDPCVEYYIAAIDSWGKYKEIEKAESAFNKLTKKLKNPSSSLYTALLNVYARNNMLDKGKELVNRMVAEGCRLNPLTWDALVRLYLGAGEVEKADSIIEKAIQKKAGKLLFSTYMAVMDKYSKRGDVHNAEKMFHMMREGGYVPCNRQYRSLLKAYAVAKEPAYGIKDRLKADNIIPNRTIRHQLANMDVFKKSPAADLLE